MEKNLEEDFQTLLEPIYCYITNFHRLLCESDFFFLKKKSLLAMLNLIGIFLKIIAAFFFLNSCQQTDCNEQQRNIVSKLTF